MRVHSKSLPFVVLALLAATTLFGCGGASSPSDAEGVVLRGTVLGEGAATATLSGRTADVVTVTVLERPSITTTVGADGSFTLRGLPEGTFTLVFTSGGVELGRVTFGEVNPNQEITITVRLTGGTVTVVEERRNGIGHGDIEIEGLVSQVLLLNNDAESRFLIAGYTVVARPGETAVREGNRGRSFSNVTVGRRVHVKGTWMTPTAGTQPVLAQEIKLQGDEGGSDDPPTPGGDPRSTCAPGQGIQVEGRISAKAGSSITVRTQSRGDFECAADTGTRIRKGNTTYTFAQLEVGWRVHVSGTSQGLAGTVCRVDAEEIKVQQN